MSATPESTQSAQAGMKDDALSAVRRSLEGHTAEWDNPRRTVRHSPPLRLAEDLAHGLEGFEPSDVPGILDGINEEALVARGERTAQYFGTTDVAANKETIRTAIKSLVYDRETGAKRSPQEFARRLNGIYNAVFTGHPTFSNNPETYAALARFFTAQASGDEVAAARTKVELRSKSNLKFERPTLDGESEQSLAAIRNVHYAISQIEEIAIEVAQEEYPDEWMAIDYAPHTVATWIPFDWDGRDDISWNVLLEKRLVLQIEMLKNYARRVEDLQQNIDPDRHSDIEAIWNKLDRTIVDLDQYRRFFRDYAPAQDPDGTKLAEKEQNFIAGVKNRITHPDELIGDLEALLVDNQSPKAAAQIVQLRSRLRNHGLSLARVHFRINSKSVLKGLKEVGIEVDKNIPEREQDNTYGAKLKARMAGLKGKDVKTISLSDIAKSEDALQKQMGLIQFMTRNLDRQSPVRFLLAETHNSLVPRAVLSFAIEAGVQGIIDISPLFEDRDGIDAARGIVSKLYADENFREYVKARGVAAFQFGYSDSGRFDGQLPAGAFIEMVKGEIILEHKRYGLENIPVKFFDTHGESIGRGTHPASVAERLNYIDTHFTLSLAGAKNVDVEPEESFQGGDGFSMMGTPEAALSYFASALEHFSADHTKTRSDIYYDKNKRRETALAFFANARRAQSELSKDPRNAALIELFGNMLLGTGSRPKKRAAASGGERELPRAIPHNGIFAQLGALVNVMYGVSEAIKADPEGFEDLMRNSPEFRKRMDLVFRAMDMSDPYILKSYVELFNPSYWLDRGRTMKDPLEREQCREIAHHMREAGTYRDLAPIVERIIEDFEVIKEARQKLDLPSDPMKDPAYASACARRKMNMNTVHGLRMASMIDLFTQAAKTPETVLQNSHRDEFMAAVFKLDLDAVREVKVPSANDNSPETIWANRLKADAATILRASQVEMNLVCAVG